ncbi:MAG: hypothetical protein WA110_00840, partial [Anaerolineaceae bacterium]
MRSTFKRFGREYRLQLKLIVGHWSYWAMHAVFAILMIALFGNRSDLAAEGMLTAFLGTVAAGLIMLVSMLLSGLAASRSKQYHLSELAETFPTGGEILLADWLASCTAGLGLLLEPIALAAYVGPFDSLLAGLFPFCWYTLAAALLGSAFTWWLSSQLKFRRWVYPLLAAAWAAFWIGPMFLSRAGIMLTLIDIPTRMQNADFDELFGRLEPAALSGWFCAFLFSLALFFLALAFWNQRSRRFNQRVWPGLPLTVLSVGLCIFCATQFSDVKGDLDQYTVQNPYNLSEAAQFYGTLTDSEPNPIQNPNNLPAASQPGNGRIENYDVSVEMSSASLPTITVKFTLRNDGDTAKDTWNLGLNHHFKIISCNYPVVRDQDSLQIQLPAALQKAQSVEVSLVYEGEFTTYSPGPQIPVANQFIDQEKARLGLDSLWLPVAEGQNLESLVAEGMLVEPVSIHLVVKAPQGVNTYSNLTEVAPGEYSASETTWVYWVASSRLTSRTLGEMQIYGTASSIEIASRHTAEIESFYRMVQSFFPQVKANPATLLLFDSRNGMENDLTVIDNRPVLVIPRIFFAYWDDSDDSAKIRTTEAIGSALMEDFYQMSGGSNLGMQEMDSLGRLLWVY